MKDVEEISSGRVKLSTGTLYGALRRLLESKWIIRFAILGCVAALFLTALTLVIGTEIKGGRRWLHILGQSVQPSEFLKPFLAVVCAWLGAVA